MNNIVSYLYLLTCIFYMAFNVANAEGNGSLTLAKKLSDKGFNSTVVKLNGISVHYIDNGFGDFVNNRVAPGEVEKPVIMFLHGFPYFASAWLPILEPLSKHYTLVAPDNRGYAYSSKPKAVNDYHISKLVGDINVLIDYLSIKGGSKAPITLVGHDWGGVLAWAVAQRYPEKIKQVIVINAPTYNTFLSTLASSESQREASRYIPWLSSWVSRLAFRVKGADLLWGESLVQLHQQGHVDDAFKEEFLAAWSQKGAAQGATSWYAANIPDFDDITTEHYWPKDKAKVTVPSLLIWSKHDKAFTQDTFNAISDDVEHLQIQVIDTTSHAPFLDHTEQVLAFLNAFLQQNDTVNRQ